MPNIYLRHEKHGHKICHSVSEAQADKVNGWEEYDPVPPAAPVVVEPDVVVTVDPSQVVESDVVAESVKPATVIPSFLAAPEDPPTVKVKKPKG